MRSGVFPGWGDGSSDWPVFERDCRVKIQTDVYLPEKDAWVYDPSLDWSGTVVSTPPIDVKRLPEGIDTSAVVNVLPDATKGAQKKYSSPHPRLVMPRNLVILSEPNAPIVLGRRRVTLLGGMAAGLEIQPGAAEAA